MWTHERFVAQFSPRRCGAINIYTAAPDVIAISQSKRAAARQKLLLEEEKHGAVEDLLSWECVL